MCRAMNVLCKAYRAALVWHWPLYYPHGPVDRSLISTAPRRVPAPSDLGLGNKSRFLYAQHDKNDVCRNRV